MGINGISTTENRQIVNAGEAERSTETAYTNSVMLQTQTTDTDLPAENNTSNTTTKLDELKALCGELGTTLEQIFHYPVEQLEDKQLQKIIDAIKLAIERATTNNKVDKEKAIELARKYAIAVSSGAYTIEELRENKNKLQGESISSRLETFFNLEKGTFMTLSETEKSNYIKRYFVDYFEELIQKNKDPEKIKKLQLRDFIKLLTNSSDEEKALFKQVITDYLLSENKPKGLFATIASFHSQEARTKWADSWTTEEKAKLGNEDQLGNVSKEEDITAMQAALIRENSKEGLMNGHADLNSKVTAVLEKVENGEELTQDEELLLKTFKQLYAGEQIGTIENDIITDKNWKQEFLKQVNNDILAHGEDVYNDIIKQMAKAVEENSEYLTMPKEELEKILDSTTGNKYSEAADAYIAEKEAARDNNETADLGFTQRENVDTTRLTFLQQQIQNSTEKQSGFKVENPITKPKAANTLNERMAEASSGQDKLAVIKEFFDRSPLLKKALEKYLTGMTDPMNILNALPTNARKYLAQKLVQKGQLTEEDIQRLNLSFNDKQLLNNILKEKEEKAEVVA